MTQILRNNDNRILRNSDGRVLQANKDFGKTLKGGSITVNYPTRQPYFHNVVWVGKQRTVQSPIWEKYIDAQRVLYGRIDTDIHWSFFIAYGIYTSNSAAFTGVASTGSAPHWAQFHLAKTGVYTGMMATYLHPPKIFTNTISTDQAQLQGREYNKLILASHMKAGEFAVFDRGLSDAEFSHYFNKGAGNEFLSGFGLVNHWKMDHAEILSCWNGTAYENKVAVRDHGSGGNHGIINGLPAGTLQEQLTYANNNFFELW